MISRLLTPVVLATTLLSLSCSTTKKQPVCRLTPLHAGICALGADHVLGEDHAAEERVGFAMYAFLVEGPGGEKALVDLGPMSLEYVNDMFRRFGFFRDGGPEVPATERYPDDIVQPHGNVFVQLEELGISPDAIHHIVFTHLHCDHHGMDDATDGGAAEKFENAILHTSRIGWDDNLSKRTDGRWNSYVDYAFSDFLARREKEGKVRFTDDIEIFPGLRTMYLGGHSIGSQAVVVETEDGPVIIASDDVYLFRLLEENILPKIRTTPGRLRQAIQKIVETAKATDGIILPMHDPQIWESYQKAKQSWLKDLRSHSDHAIEGYEQPDNPR